MVKFSTVFQYSTEVMSDKILSSEIISGVVSTSVVLSYTHLLKDKNLKGVKNKKN
jgi:hypothetical protein